MREEANIVQMLLCTNIRMKSKGVIEPWMFETEVYRAFAVCLINDRFDKEDIDTNLLKVYIKNKYPSLKESDFLEIQRLIDDYNEIEEDDEKFVLNILADFFRKKIYSKGLQYIANDEIQKAEDYIVRATNLNLAEREYINLANKDKILELLERKFPKDGKYFKSSFGLINENSTFKGYRRGDLVQVVAPTGRGKTSMMCQEAVTLAHQGFKIGYAIVGDNEQDDITVKFCSYLSKTPINEIIGDLGQYIDKYTKQLEMINSIDYPMYSVTVSELLSDFKRIKAREGLDVLFVDYDQNIAMAHENMYESGGLIYGALKAFAQVEDCVVIVASQPKIDAWNTEIIEVSKANESSKKQANVDMMITFNWNPECKKVGSMYIAKIRRGTCEVISRIKFNHHISELKEISKPEYDHIISTSKALQEGLDLDESIDFGG